MLLTKGTFEDQLLLCVYFITINVPSTFVCDCCLLLFLHFVFILHYLAIWRQTLWRELGSLFLFITGIEGTS